MRKIYIILLLSVIAISGCGDRDGRGRTAGGRVDTVIKPKSTKPFVINVYIENSGSIDGYVKGVTEFEQAVYNYLSDIKISGITDTLNLFYINSQIIPQRSDITDFIEKLDPASFKQKGGNRTSSDIANVLDTVLKEIRRDKVAILVTDGIFSPGKGKNSAQFLVNQEIGIKRIFADYLKNNHTAAVIVYQLSSKFDGTYFNNTDQRIPINAQRPFYIWIIGDIEQLIILRKKVSDEKLKLRSGNQFFNVFAVMNGGQPVKYAIKPSSGKFELSKKRPKTDIENLGKDSRTSTVKFAVNVDFSPLLLDETYILNTDNYDNSSKYSLKVKENLAKSNGYSHTLEFTSDKVIKGPVSIKLKARFPDWVGNTNDSSGVNAVTGKTYGIKHQLSGVFDAFTFTNKYYTDIKININ